MRRSSLLNAAFCSRRFLDGYDSVMRVIKHAPSSRKRRVSEVCFPQEADSVPVLGTVRITCASNAYGGDAEGDCDDDGEHPYAADQRKCFGLRPRCRISAC